MFICAVGMQGQKKPAALTWRTSKPLTTVCVLDQWLPEGDSKCPFVCSLLSDESLNDQALDSPALRERKRELGGREGSMLGFHFFLQHIFMNVFK